MSDLHQIAARANRVVTALETMPEDEQQAVINKIKKEAGAQSRFKRWQLVRVLQPRSFSLATFESMYDPNDPSQYFDSRVMGWDLFGRIEVATPIHNNPHCSEWCWSDDKVFPRDGEDWVDKSSFKLGMEIFFTWELDSFSGAKLGAIIPAKLLGPHIEPGDWLVEYPRQDSGHRITRVLNEKQMRFAA